VDKEYHFEIVQGGLVVAEGSGADLDNLRFEMLHYAMVYVQDGPVLLKGSPELMPELGCKWPTALTAAERTTGEDDV
jgi:hypothetical protein